MKPFAIYFPQFYPIPTNDQAWGKGFTDWTLVANANLRNHWMRRAPARGFYDGASPDLHRDHLVDARNTGIGGFGLYHYWFFTHQELAAFEQTLLQSPTKDSLPWFLIWASEGWSRRWLGDPSTLVNLASEPDIGAIEQHCDHLAWCFAHPNYYRMHGRPLFAWYNLGHFRNPEKVIEQYRRCLSKRGFDVALANFVKNPFDTQYCGLTEVSYLFEPRLYFGLQRIDRGTTSKRILDRLSSVFGEPFVSRLLVFADHFHQKGQTHSASHFLRYLESPERKALVGAIPGITQEVVTPGWNNTPRYGARFTALEDLPPEAFGKLVREALQEDKVPPLINAWNEWSEGAAIEACAYLGSRYLDALRETGLELPLERAVGAPIGS